MRKVDLTLCAIIRDQAHYVKEWLTFYYLVGVDRMVVCLHKCQDNTEQQIKSLPFFDTHVKLYQANVDAADMRPHQLGVYKQILTEWGQSTEWIMFVDADEFYFGTMEDSLPAILDRYREYGGLAANWVMFGPGDNVLRPTGLVTESLTKRKPLLNGYNRSVKTINRSREILTILTPHTCLTRLSTVTEHGDDRFVGPCGLIPHNSAIPSWDIVRCNHYFVRSLEDWVAKARRGSCNNGWKGPTTEYHLATMATLRNFLDCNEEDTTILRFVSRIKEVLEL